MTAPHAMGRELVLSSLMGPLRYVVPILSYALLYPLILRRFGLELLGFWSLLATILGYISLADAGFSATFIREMAHGSGESLASAHGREYRAAQFFYAGLLALLLVLLALSVPFWKNHVAGLPTITSAGVFGLDLAVMFTAATITLAAKLNSAILMAQAQIVYAQAVSAVMPALILAANLAGILTGRPIEALALGTLAASASEYLLFRRRLRKILPGFHSSLPKTLPFRDGLASLKGLMGRGKYLYLYQIGGLVREPVFRLIVGAGIGLAAVGVFDIALRLTRTMMDLSTGGLLRALFPAMSRLVGGRETERAGKLFRASMVATLFLAASVQGGICLMAEPFYRLWLGSVPEQLMPTTFVLAACFLFTTASMPLRNLLMACRLERVNAMGTWMQILLSLFLLPLLPLLDIDIAMATAVWGLGFVLAVPMLHVFTLKKCPEIAKAIQNQTMALLALAAAAAFSLMLGLHARTPGLWSQFLLWGVVSAVLGVGFLRIAGRRKWIVPAHFKKLS